MLVDEPTVEDTIAILRGLKERYEVHHGVDITDPAIVAAATLSHRYITDRQLPDKAIDLIDEAASRIRIEIDSKPESMDRLDRRLVQLKIEREALKKESDEASRGASRGSSKSRTCRSGEASTRTSRRCGRAEKAAVVHGTAARQGSTRAGTTGIRDRPAGGRPATRMSELQYGRIPELERELDQRECRPMVTTARRRCFAGTRSPMRRLPKWSPSGPGSRSTKMLEGEK